VPPRWQNDGGVCVTLGEKALGVRYTGRFFIVWQTLSGHLCLTMQP